MKKGLIGEAKGYRYVVLQYENDKFRIRANLKLIILTTFFSVMCVENFSSSLGAFLAIDQDALSRPAVEV